jgi:PHD/YefM family antitoxin component YafN of YafNO toxin-antitoxin module
MSPNAQFLTDKDGKKTAVLLPLAEYEQLLEDLEDLAAIVERRKEPTVPHEQFIRELKKDGLLPA